MGNNSVIFSSASILYENQHLKEKKFSFRSNVVVFFNNPVALRMSKTLWSFGHSECKRITQKGHIWKGFVILGSKPGPSCSKHRTR